MKKFQWRLERVLALKKKQLQQQQMELLAITEKMTEIRTSLLLEKRKLADALSRTSEPGLNAFNGQELCLRFSLVNERRIRQLDHQLSQLKHRQQEKINEVLTIRRFTEGLERLRTKAKTQYISEQEKLEQKQYDENNSSRFIRNLLVNPKNKVEV